MLLCALPTRTPTELPPGAQLTPTPNVCHTSLLQLELATKATGASAGAGLCKATANAGGLRLRLRE